MMHSKMYVEGMICVQTAINLHWICCHRAVQEA